MYSALDLVVASIVDAGIATLEGNGDGTFGPPVEITGANFRTTSIALDHIDADGRLDFVAVRLPDGSTPSSTAVLFHSTSTGFSDAPVVLTLEPAGSQFNLTPDAATTADLNNDGNADILVEGVAFDGFNPFRSAISVLLGQGDGTFQIQPLILTNLGDITNLTVGFVDDDNDLDIIFTGIPSFFFGFNEDSSFVMLGRGDGSFELESLFAPFGGLLHAADLNNDQFNDVVINNPCNNTITVLLGNGDRSFRTPLIFKTANEPNDLALLDVDGDGDLDLISADQLGPGITVLTNLLLP